jgi:tetratricopeptide (TPR) repeat protein
LQQLARDPRSTDGAANRCGGAWLALGLLVALGCALGACGGMDVTPEPGVPASQRDFLLDPFAGPVDTLDQSVRQRIETAYRSMLESGDPSVAATTAQALLALDPELAPARVLAAQADFVARRYAAVIGRLEGRLDDDGTLAGLLVLGRAAELDGLIPLAFDAYRRAALRNAVAARRANTLRDRAQEAVLEELDASLARGHFAEAAAKVAVLESWASGERVALEARRRFARAGDDRRGELEALRLLAQVDDEPELLERLGLLELEVGDARSGLEIFEELVRRSPDEPRLEDLLSQAKFLWRLEMLPPQAQELVQRSELSRGDFATLLYWLVPNMRSGGSGEARIATDVLDHPQRDAIVRVLNLGIMEVEDDTLHRFAPDLPVARVDALDALLRIPLEFGDDVQCVRDLAVLSQVTASYVCQTAARCGLVPSTQDCLPAATLGGREALDLVRRALAVLGEG